MFYNNYIPAVQSLLPPRPVAKTPKQKMKPLHWAPLQPMAVSYYIT